MYVKRNETKEIAYPMFQDLDGLINTSWNNLI